MKKTVSSSSELPSKKNDYIFNIDSERTFQLSSNFESGNINLVKQIHELYYILESVNDVDGQSKKSWFYFKMKAQRGIKVRIILQNVFIYETAFEEKSLCKPVCREGEDGKWQPLADSFLTYRDEIVLVIDHTFKNSEYIYICLTIPFTYSDNQDYLLRMKESVNPRISYQDQILCLTPQGRSVHLLTITEKSSKKSSKAKLDLEDRKPVVLLTSRVHPGEVSSSYCMQGMLQFLLSYNNLQAYLLRRLFIFKIVPMLNPDGVYQGNYRMDPQGRNLNRFYLDPNKQQHRAIYEITQLMKTTALKQKIEFYFDLHSHSSIKESFIYGNALDDIVQQTYSQLFCKILEENYPRFRYSLSNFDEKQMKHKDKGQSMSKQGCGRVVINKFCGVVQSYTVQSSIFSSAYECFINKGLKSEVSNKEFVYSIEGGQSSYEYEQIYEANGEESLLVVQNKRLGKSIMVSILDMIRKNPYSRFGDENRFGDEGMDVVSKDICIKLLQTEDRFKLMDMKAYQKSRLIQTYIKSCFEDKIDREWNICGVQAEFNAVNWPKEIRKMIIIQPAVSRDKGRSKVKSLRVKTEGREKLTSQSLSKAMKQQKLQIKGDNPSSHRSNSPLLQQQPQKPLLPQIKYSIELKPKWKQGSDKLKRPIVKEMQLNLNENGNLVEGEKVKKKMIIDYIQEQISKIAPDKQIFKRSNASLNRLIANKIMEKEKAKTRNCQINQYQKIIVQSRKRIMTECKDSTEEIVEGKPLKDRTIDNDDETTMKGLELRKADLMKKRFMMTNKAIELIRTNDRAKTKLSDTNKLNLIISNAKKECQLSHEQNSESRY